MKPHALDLEFRLGIPHNALWADSEDRHQEAGIESQYFGLVLGIRWGHFICTLPWSGSWLDANRKNTRVFRFNFLFPWISISISKYGFYFGAKDFGWLPVYVLNGIWPDGNEGDRALTFSASIRRTRIT
jgi:hypothetical protein